MSLRGAKQGAIDFAPALPGMDQCKRRHRSERGQPTGGEHGGPATMPPPRGALKIAVAVAIGFSCGSAQLHTVCMDEENAALMSGFPQGSPEYDMLMARYKFGIADSMGVTCTLNACDIDVKSTRSTLLCRSTRVYPGRSTHMLQLA